MHKIKEIRGNPTKHDSMFVPITVSSLKVAVSKSRNSLQTPTLVTPPPPPTQRIYIYKNTKINSNSLKTQFVSPKKIIICNIFLNNYCHAQSCFFLSVQIFG